MKKKRYLMFSLLLGVASMMCGQAENRADSVKAIEGSWLNLFYQDVRNKYSNPENLDNTDPEFWRAKINELHKNGVKYLIFMAVANDGKADYPSKIMPHAYNDAKESPVSVIMQTADKLGMKVFMSIGWAENQDDNLRIKSILNRQKAIMNELGQLYGNYKSFYGWYLPVEDCLGPVLSEDAVKAVNELVSQARKLTPGKKTLISPYGICDSDFANEKYAKQIKKLNVDIIAYQDEIGCVREDYPLPRLKRNWKELKKIHSDSKIEMWANCELFTWEKDVNDRQSALIPAAFPRILSQMAAAAQAGAEHLASFMVYGLWDSNDDRYNLGQPVWSKKVLADYNAWRKGEGRWPYLEASFKNKLKGDQSVVVSKGDSRLIDGKQGEEDVNEPNWVSFEQGYNEVELQLVQPTKFEKLFVRFLDCNKNQIQQPQSIYVYITEDGKNYTLYSVKNTDCFPNNLHDSWIDGVLENGNSRVIKGVKIGFETKGKSMLDEIYINPIIEK